MPNENEIEAKKKRINEESFDAGRLLGIVARRDPELYERLKIYAEQEGIKLSELVYDALSFYDEYLSLSTVDTKSLLAALKLLDHLFKRLMQMMLTLNQFFTSEFFTQQIEIMHNLKQQQQQQAIEEKRVKKEEIRDQLVMTMVNTVLSLISNMMMSLSRLSGGQAQPQVPQMVPRPQPIVERPKIVKGAQK